MSESERLIYARLTVYQRALDDLIKEAREACQPYAKRHGRRLDWWRGQFDGLVCASALLAPVQYPDHNPNEEAAARALLKTPL